MNATAGPQYVVADRLLVGGVPSAEFDGVALEKSRISGLVRRGTALPAGMVVRYPGSTILPGLVDAHTHVCMAWGEDLSQPITEELLASSVERGRLTAEGILAAGVTTARDLGARGRAAQLVRGSLASCNGPRLVVSGRPITSPDGHFASFGITARGPREAAQAVDTLAEEGVDLIKLVLTGGTSTPGTDPSSAQFNLDEVRAVTERARAHNLRVAAHAHGLAGIELAVDAGVDTIEHCSWATAESFPGEPVGRLVDRIVEQGITIVVAGPLPAELAPGYSSKLPGTLTPSAGRVLKAWANAATLIEAGAQVALGTDSLFGQFPGWQDLIIRAEALVAHGSWAPAQVVKLMTEAGAAALGLSGSIGRLGPGYQADLLVVGGDPSTDIRCLHRACAVYKGGQLMSGSLPEGKANDFQSPEQAPRLSGRNGLPPRP
jgi:imidazolonepropionase-like amidohydrolase